MWTTYAPAVLAAFLGSTVEVVEAFTIILAASTIRGPRPALLGAAAGFGVLALIVLVFGPLLNRIPLQPFRLAMGLLLLLFGLRWLRKAILRAAGVIPLHDEAAAFDKEQAALRVRSDAQSRLNWLAGITAFKAVLVEGLEVVFIVLAVGAGQGLVGAASLGALAACVAVLAVGALLRRPLSRVPENTLKFAVGVMLSSFGVFWCGEGLGIPWPFADLSILSFVALFAALGLTLARIIRRVRPTVAKAA